VRRDDDVEKALAPLPTGARDESPATLELELGRRPVWCQNPIITPLLVVKFYRAEKLGWRLKRRGGARGGLIQPNRTCSTATCIMYISCCDQNSSHRNLPHLSLHTKAHVILILMSFFLLSVSVIDIDACSWSHCVDMRSLTFTWVACMRLA
jgi:hypothetical protein